LAHTVRLQKQVQELLWLEFCPVEPVKHHKELQGLIFVLFIELFKLLRSHILTKFILWAESGAHKQTYYS
jgi:hypothetical protein